MTKIFENLEIVDFVWLYCWNWEYWQTIISYLSPKVYSTIVTKTHV